jgi:hypothetical protein
MSCFIVDLRHLGNLVSFLDNIVLIHANGIDPEANVFLLATELQ